MSTVDIDLNARICDLLGYARPPAGKTRTLLLCLPAGSSRNAPPTLPRQVAAHLRHHLGVAGVTLCPDHLYAQPDLTPLEQSLLLAPRPDGQPLCPCAGAPLGLLDTARSAALIAEVAAEEHAAWTLAVAGTPPATPLRDLLDTHLAGDHQRALTAFCAQPRIAAMTAAHHCGETTFVPDDYGPALAAHQAGADAHARYLVDLMQLGDALLTLDGQLLRPSNAAGCPLAESFQQRRAYHHAARQYLASADPNTVLVAGHTTLPI